MLREKARLLAEADAVKKEISGGQLHEYVEPENCCLLC